MRATEGHRLRLLLTTVAFVAACVSSRYVPAFAQGARTFKDVVYATVDGKDLGLDLEGAYEKLGLDVYFDVVHGAAHGGDLFFAPARVARAVAFLRRTIGQ